MRHRPEQPVAIVRNIRLDVFTLQHSGPTGGTCTHQSPTGGTYAGDASLRPGERPSEGVGQSRRLFQINLMTGRWAATGPWKRTPPPRSAVYRMLGALFRCIALFREQQAAGVDSRHCNIVTGGVGTVHLVINWHDALWRLKPASSFACVQYRLLRSSQMNATSPLWSNSKPSINASVETMRPIVGPPLPLRQITSIYRLK